MPRPVYVYYQWMYFFDLGLNSVKFTRHRGRPTISLASQILGFYKKFMNTFKNKFCQSISYLVNCRYKLYSSQNSRLLSLTYLTHKDNCSTPDTSARIEKHYDAFTLETILSNITLL